MSALHEIWRQIPIDLDLESHIAKLLCEKIVNRREKSMFKITQRILKQLDVSPTHHRQPSHLRQSLNLNKTPSYLRRLD